MDFSSMISDDNRTDIVTQRLGQFIGEGYQLTLNKKTAERLGREDQIEAINESLALIEVAIAVHQEELAKIAVASLDQ